MNAAYIAPSIYPQILGQIFSFYVRFYTLW